jgi:catechol 2,3-dioxygenase-like lactoylglutathione lyase family enzyme
MSSSTRPPNNALRLTKPAKVRAPRHSTLPGGAPCRVARSSLMWASQLNTGCSTDLSERGSMTTSTKVRMTSFAPQFLVDDLIRSIAYYEKIGFRFGEPWDGFYAIGHLDGLEVHLKEAPKYQAERQWRRDNEHLDASSGVDGIEAFYERCVANGVAIIKPLTATAWGTKDFYVEDPDGYLLSFGGRPAAVEQ